MMPLPLPDIVTVVDSVLWFRPDNSCGVQISEKTGRGTVKGEAENLRSVGSELGQEC